MGSGRIETTPHRYNGIGRYAGVLALAGLVTLASAPALLAGGAPSDEIADESADMGSSDLTDAVTAPEIELVYSVNRTPEPTFDTARAVEVITAEEIRRKNARTLPELLMEEAGVFVQQTNYGGGAPIIRGLIGKQVLILVNGVRLNNATFRFGPIQYLNTIDLAAVERVEIVRGVGSVLGSDALGGTINVVTKMGPSLQEEEGADAYFSSRFSSGDESVTGRVGFSGRSAKTRFTGGVTYRDTGSVEAGGSIGEQIGTAYDEAGADFHMDYHASDEKTVSFTYLGLDQESVPRTDRIQSGRNLVFDFEPQKNQIAAVTFQDLTSRGIADSFKVTGYWNNQEEGRLEIRSSAPTTERRLSDKVETVGFNLELGKFVGSHRVLYGIDFSTDDIQSGRVDTNLVTGTTAAKRGAYTDGASYELLAGYLQDQFDLGERVNLTLGGRYSRFSAAGREDSSVGVLDLKSSDESLTGSVNLVVKATEELNLVANVTRGFRAPNIEDLSVFDERDNGTEVPNPNLGSETIESREVGLKFRNDRFSGSAFYYEADLTDLLVRQPGTLNGLSFFDLNGDGLQDADEPNVLQKQNVGAAAVEGFELSGNYRVKPSVTVHGNYTTTTGDDLTAGVPLRRIPPAFGTLGARWSSRRGYRPWMELVYHFAEAQRRLNPSDISDSRIGPNGTDGFDVLHLRSGVSFGDAFAFTLALENLTDEEYKYHASGVMRPGFQVVIGLQYGLR